MGFWGRAERDVLKGSLSLIGASLSCCEFTRSRGALSFYLTEPIHQWLDHSKPKTNSFLLGGLGGWDTMPLFFLEAQRRVLWRKQKNPCVSDEVYPLFFCREEEWDPTQSQGKRPRPLTFDGRLLNMDWSDKANFLANQIFSESTRLSLFQDWFPLTAW